MSKRIVALGVIVAAGLLAVAWSTLSSTSSTAATSVEEVSRELVAPCCWSQTVDIHESQIAAQMRWEIGNMINKGMSKGAILSFYTAKYGEQILARPPMTGFGLVAYGLPVLFVAIGSALVYYLFTSWVNRRNLETSRACVPVSSLSSKTEALMRERLRQELDLSE